MMEKRKKMMSNKQWIDLLSKEWKVSRTYAKTMLHSMYMIKKEHDQLQEAFYGGKTNGLQHNSIQRDKI